MKLRYYKDSNVYFTILCIIYSDDTKPYKAYNDGKFSTLKDAVSSISANKLIYKELKSNQGNKLVITMQETNQDRDSTENNILYYCRYAIFIFGTDLKLEEVTFFFRDHIDPELTSATYYIKNNLFEYNSDDIDIMDYLKEECLDKDLANFLINDCTSISY